MADEDDLVVRRGLVIPAAEVRETASRASGPGGQHVNKSNTRVTLRWNVDASGQLNATQRHRLRDRLGARVTRSGDLVVHADTRRSRSQNRALARERLAELVRDALRTAAPRVATKPSRRAVARAVDAESGDAVRRRIRAAASGATTSDGRALPRRSRRRDGSHGRASPLHEDEERFAHPMGVSRRREFAAGRDCARRAMRALGAEDGPVLRGVRRAPRFPDGLVGAITHTRGYCAAAVARASALAGVGIDAEQWKPLSERALARICFPEEIEHLKTLRMHRPEQWGAAVFSAKESLYKAYFPITETFIGFRDASLLLHPESRTTGHFEARLTRDDIPSAANQRTFTGRYQLLATPKPLVVTGLVIPHDSGHI